MGEALEAPALTRVRLRLFGAFRQVAPELMVEVPRGTTVAELRRHVKQALARTGRAAADDDLVELSAVASDAEILSDSDRLGGGDVSLALLPPVCGG
jgi:molybdopterin converting factor small subunit